jgi:hypothetical protein
MVSRLASALFILVSATPSAWAIKPARAAWNQVVRAKNALRAQNGDRALSLDAGTEAVVRRHLAHMKGEIQVAHGVVVARAPNGTERRLGFDDKGRVEATTETPNGSRWYLSDFAGPTVQYDVTVRRPRKKLRNIGVEPGDRLALLLKRRPSIGELEIRVYRKIGEESVALGDLSTSLGKP